MFVINGDILNADFNLDNDLITLTLMGIFDKYKITLDKNEMVLYHGIQYILNDLVTMLHENK